MNRFLQWFKNLVLPFENKNHPLYYSKESELLEQARQDAALRFVIGNYTYERLFLTMPQFIQGPAIPNTIPATNSKFYGHWNDPSMKPARDAAREAARAAGYYARHTHY
jgi:hypothetical protein